MKPFRFRAQPALDLRQREDDDARRVCAEAESHVMAAQARNHQARADLAGGQAAHALHTGTGTSEHEREWYRFWISGLEQAVLTTQEALGACQAELATCRKARQVTRLRVDALERFKQKARQAYDQAELAEEQRLTDAAGTARFVAQRRALLLGRTGSEEWT